MNDEFICKKCNGIGIDIDLLDEEYKDRIEEIDFVEDDGVFCLRCKGKGKVDWITNIMNGG